MNSQGCRWTVDRKECLKVCQSLPAATTSGRPDTDQHNVTIGQCGSDQQGWYDGAVGVTPGQRGKTRYHRDITHLEKEREGCVGGERGVRGG